MVTTRLRVRFTMQWLMLGVALNLAGAMVTVKEEWSGGGRSLAGEIASSVLTGVPRTVSPVAMGRASNQTGDGARIREEWRLPRAQTHFQVHSLVIASASITLLVLALRFWKWGEVPADAPPDAGVCRRSLPARVWLGARWVVLAAALIALNVAGDVYQPLFDLYKRKMADCMVADIADRAQCPHRFILLITGAFAPSSNETAAPRMHAGVDL
ncbi:hypothetical protein OJF2_49840 [Aquisphaera giovannonii]|uniref:Uncharacterized protein n=1 Tax=Aquisphaera giovannonii TaxID=406548 RepID=A0A5B9W963_9BACT|nr:hypothetical protein [Aquisphaera giovannonii]QEH36420.1 hypothetical protein OJF2_49840 [Aquisphaera giovannonii]